MGKKEREEREQERESFYDKRQKQQFKYKAIGLGVLAGIVAVLGISSYNFYELSSHVTPAGMPVGAGPLGGINIKAGLLTLIYGQQFDYSSPAYQVKSRYIDFEKGNGEIVHMHAANVTMSFLFDSLKIGLTDKCFTFPDKRSFCTNDKYSMKFFINHHQIEDIRNYVFNDGDRILISYGNENATQISNQLAGLDAFNLNS
ncbi:MAG TPA: protein-disulfide isomerase [Candidatus Bathyarchaeia archaeon]|nr:protein-disulfide isomerase [Candidatus Bathyarchaeia archaeon]